jgi:hypothetical protein
LLLALCAGAAFAQSGDILINDDTAGGCLQRAPACAALPEGGYLVVWEDYRRSDYDPNIYCRQMNDYGAPIGLEWVVNQDTVSRKTSDYRQASPAIAVNARGVGLVAWEDYRAGLSQVRYQPVFSGHALLDRDPCAGPSPLGQIEPAVTALGRSWVITWCEGGAMIRGALIDSSGAPNTEFAVTDTGVLPSVAAFGSGFVVAWQQVVGESNAVCLRWFNSAGQALGLATLAANACAARPRVACDSQGDGIVTWEETASPGQRIWTRSFDYQGNWRADPFVVNELHDNAASQPAVAAAPGTDRCVVAWQDARNGPSQIFAQTLDLEGNMAGSNFPIELVPASAGESMPVLAMSAALVHPDDFAAFWIDLREGDANIYGVVGSVSRIQGFKDSRIRGKVPDSLIPRFLDSGLNAFRVNTDRATAIQDFPVINLDSSGNALCFFYDFRNGAQHPAVWCQRLNRDGTRNGINFRVNDDTANRPATSYWAATSRFGRTMVAWQDARNSDPDIYAQRYDSRTNPLGSNFRVNDDTGAAAQTWPFVAVNDSGASVIIWADDRTRVPSPFAQLFDRDGNRLGPNFRVSFSGREPSAWISNQGDVWLTWISPVGIRLRHFDASGTALDTALHITEGNSGIFGAPKVNGAALGSVWLVWMDKRRGDWEVYAQRVDPTGRLIGANFRLNDDDVLCEHWLPWITWDRADKLYVTWTDMRIPGDLDVRCLVLDTSGVARDSSFIVNTDPELGVDQWAYGSVAARGPDVVFTWIDNRNLRSWDIYARIGLPPVSRQRWWTGLQVLPSVTRDECLIRPTIPVRGPADLAVYDVTGREVRRFRDLVIVETGGSVAASLGDLPAGMYLVRLRVQGLALGAKLVKVR